jgi:regulator of sigma E protease
MQGRQRSAVLDLDTLSSKDIDTELMRNVGLGSPYSEPVIGEVKAGGPAAAAGLLPGDLVLSIDGKTMTDRGQLLESIRGSIARNGEGRPMQWRVLRSGQPIEIAVQPVVVLDNEQRIGRIQAGVGKPPEMVNVRYGAWDGLTQAVGKTWDMSALTLRMLGRMLIGEASLKNLSGPLTIADYAGQSVRLGLAYYLSFLAVVSVSLGVLNLLPLPMLDGGHLMYYLFEAVTGRPVSDVWLERLQRGGVAIMLMMTSLALYNDVARLLGLH